MQRFFLVFVSLFIFLCAKAQQGYVSLNRLVLIKEDAALNELSNTSHTALKPYLNSFLTKDTANLNADNYKNKGWLSRKSFHESLFVIDSSDYRFTIDPVFNLEYNKDSKDKLIQTPLYTNSRGIRITGDIGKKFSFETSFYENQSVFVNYLSDFVSKYSVVPGQGRIKPFKSNGFDYAMASSLISFSPLKKLNFTFGTGKNFIGEGYRSLLLSDNSFNYPFLKRSVLLFENKLQYNTIHAWLQSLDRASFSNTPEALFVRKRGTFHYLSLNVSKRLQIGFFEGIIWKASANNYAKSPNILFYNPIMFINSILFANDTNNNVLNGLNIKYKPLNKMAVYGQLALDNFRKKRYAYQLGFKAFDVMGLQNLVVQAEYNVASAATYSFNNPLQSYTHYNQALAHPLGTGFSEALGIINYSYKSFYTQLKVNYINTKRQSGTVFQGYDIFQSDVPVYGLNPVLDPEKIKIIYQNYELGYVLNPKVNMRLSAGLILRNYSSLSKNNENQIFYLSFSSSILNRYYDF